MFTGIIEAQGLIRDFKYRKKNGVLEIEAPKISRGLKVGGSLAVNGVCLTVVKKRRHRLFFNIVSETYERTTLGTLKKGVLVNLERALKANARIEGHFVLGHVDGVGEILKVLEAKRQKSFLISFPRHLRAYLTEKGSVAVDGVGLTLGKISKNAFWVHCIPHTLKVATLGRTTVKNKVNLEADIVAKLIAKAS